MKGSKPKMMMKKGMKKMPKKAKPDMANKGRGKMMARLDGKEL